MKNRGVIDMEVGLAKVMLYDQKFVWVVVIVDELVYI
jgi:hypothetical protein